MSIFPIIALSIELVFIIKGSDWFVDSAIWFASFFKVPQIIIGVVLISVCTTLPETIVSVSSSLIGYSNLALGNAIGSISFNTGFILGLVIFVSKPNIHGRRDFFINGILLLALLLYVMVNIKLFGGIPKGSGFILLGIFVLFLFWNVKRAEHSAMVEEYIDTDQSDLNRMIVLFIIGMALIFIGARLLVINAEIVAKMCGISDSVIGLTVAAVGTSLPELMTAITAMAKGAYSLSIGNIIGVNIYNILMAVSLSAVVGDMKADASWLIFHIPAALLINLALILFASINRKNFSRFDGFFIMVLYGVYFCFMTFWGVS
jgi:K+-dependent Na+/Ca+ exchanger related-protein